MLVRFMTPTHFRVQALLSMLLIATRPGSFCPRANRRWLIFGLEVGVRPEWETRMGNSAALLIFSELFASS